MIEGENLNPLPQFPKDVSRENCAYTPLGIGEVTQEILLGSTTVEPSNVVARCENPSPKEALHAQSETTRMAVVTVNPETGEALLTPLTRAADGTIELRLPTAGKFELRLLLETKGHFHVAVQKNGSPLFLQQIQPGHYKELLASPKGEHPQTPKVISLAEEIGMNPTKSVEVNGRYFFESDDAQPIMEPLVGRQDAAEDILTVQVIIPVASRGISFGPPQTASGGIDKITDSLMLHGCFRIRVAKTS